MEITIKKAELGGTVKAIASKSQAHRLLICAALSSNPTHILCGDGSEDIEATVRCLNALGAKITRNDSGYTVLPLSREHIKKGASLDCGESGSLLRFILPITCALGADAALYSSGRLPERPLSPLYEELVSHGAVLSEQGKVPLKCAGTIRSGKYSIAGNISSQFISGLLFSLPLLSGDSELELTGDIESLSYIKLTLNALKIFKISFSFDGSRFIIPGNQKYVTPGTAAAEGDWSNAAFWLCAGALSDSKIACSGLDLNSFQGDKAVLELLKSFGAKVEFTDGSVGILRGDLRGIEIDARDIPDLVPILAAVASVSEGITKVKNAHRLRLKESDRLAAITDTLSTLGADIKQTEDGLIINGVRALKGGTVSAFGDHRIAMMAAIAAIRCCEPVTILGAEAVNKSYPGFFRDFEMLGGLIQAV